MLVRDVTLDKDLARMLSLAGDELLHVSTAVLTRADVARLRLPLVRGSTGRRGYLYVGRDDKTGEKLWVRPPVRVLHRDGTELSRVERRRVVDIVATYCRRG